MTDPQQFLIYQSEDGSTRIDVMLEAETLWLSQKQLTELFGKAKGTISEHIKHIFEDGELDENSVVRFFRTTAADGKQYEVAHYSLDMVLALGFRVRSPVGVRFRQWANDKLKEYIVKGFVLDDARLKNPGKGLDYFDELTRRLQDIRTSERRFYQKITDIYATSVDYDASHQLTQVLLPRCRARCTTPSTARRPPSWSRLAPTAASRIWGWQHGKAHVSVPKVGASRRG